MDKSLYFTEILGIKNQELLEKFSKAATIKAFKKGSNIVKKGEYQGSIYFLIEGILRGYSQNSHGKEVTECFIYRYGQPAMGSYQLEDVPFVSIMAEANSICMKISKAKIQEWMVQYPELLLVYNEFLVKEMEEHQEIKRVMYMLTATERYDWFLKNYDNMINRVSHKLVASFLNMTPVSLSRLRRQRNQKIDLNVPESGNC